MKKVANEGEQVEIHKKRTKIKLLHSSELHPPKQTWNLKMDPWKRRFLLETIISRFHVNFLGCNIAGWKKDPD